jgi:Trk K+ transport system NAD-binding subunit
MSGADPGDSLFIVIGGDALALSTARELCVLERHRVAVLWRADREFAAAVERVGAVFIAARPDSAEGLARAGVGQAAAVLALSPDDRLNLHAALRARDANPAIRIVLRLFNRTLARKLEQNLTNCSVLSLAWQSAATYAAAGVDPTCFHGVQFPEPDGPLTGFVTRVAGSCGVAGYRLAEAERELEARILAVDGDIHPSPEALLAEQAQLVAFGEIARLQASMPRRPAVRQRRPIGRRLRARWRNLRIHLRRFDPIFLRLALVALGVLLIGAWHFHRVFGDWLSAFYFVVTTMTTTGYGDLTPARSHPLDVIAAMLLMLLGIAFSGLFIAFVASLLTRAQWVSMQGLRRVNRRGHIVACGAGSIGSEVIQLLLQFEKPLVVVEIAPDAALVEAARDRRFDLLTGDASRDATLDLCNLAAAHGLVALTNADTLNLEIALGARARNPTMPIVLRIADPGFAASIARHFEFETTFSAEALAAPAFAGLAHIAGARGRIAFAGSEFVIAEFDDAGRPPPDAIPLALGREDAFALTEGETVPTPGERLLALVPLAPRLADQPPLATAAEPVADR